MLKSLFLCAGLALAQAAAAGHYYMTNAYPNLEEAKLVGQRAEGNVLNVCCSYPQMADLEALKAARTGEITVRAGHFPTADDLQALEALKVPYTLVLSEVFPSAQDIALLNKSGIKLLHILSKDFPTAGEVEAFNQFSVPVRFDNLKMRLPLKEEMDVIHLFKPAVTVGFYNRMVPGPGHAGFFNALNTKKVFVVREQFPWGIDAEGFNLLDNAALEIDPSERLMPQDVAILNQFKVLPSLVLSDIWPFNDELISNVKNIKAARILMLDNGAGELFRPEYALNFASSQSPVMFQFQDYR